MPSQINLFNEDCLPAMRKMKDKEFDLAICDPPYGIGVSNASEIGYRGFNVFTPKDWDNSIPDASYFNELFRVSREQVIWGGNYFGLRATRCYLVWDKGEGFKDRSYAEAELAWTSFDKNVRVYKRDPLARGDYKNKKHPCQKPIELYKWLLKNYATPGYKILDTHLGSGSIAIACYDMGFDLVGYEIDAEYYADAVKRLENHKKQLQLF